MSIMRFASFFRVHQGEEQPDTDEVNCKVHETLAYSKNGSGHGVETRETHNLCIGRTRGSFKNI